MNGSDHHHTPVWLTKWSLMERINVIFNFQIGFTSLYSFAFLCKVLPILEVKGVPFQLTSCKSLALNTCVNRWDSPAIASLLRSSPNLETLVINMTPPLWPGPYNKFPLSITDAVTYSMYMEYRQGNLSMR
ncbi:hypothetical protein CsSME_00032141 [Camellia sinensis var. sinensis]